MGFLARPQQSTRPTHRLHTAFTRRQTTLHSLLSTLHGSLLEQFTLPFSLTPSMCCLLGGVGGYVWERKRWATSEPAFPPVGSCLAAAHHSDLPAQPIHSPPLLSYVQTASLVRLGSQQRCSNNPLPFVQTANQSVKFELTARNCAIWQISAAELHDV